MAHWIPVPFFVAAVVLLVRARFAGDRRGVFTFKPAASALFVLVALLSLLQPGARPAYTAWIVVGLLFGMGGDVALMFHSRRAFLLGLALFLVGHVVYAVVWTAFSGFHPVDLVSAVLLLAAAVAVMAYLRPGLGAMQAPVAAYVLVICFMVNRALSTFSGSYFTPTQAWLLSLGALLFWLSDLVLAVNRFRKPLRREAAGLFLYYGGQLLIALSPSYF